MKHIQKKALLVISAILHTNVFSQRGLWTLINEINGGDDISLGNVNRVVTELENMGFISRTPGEMLSEMIEKRPSTFKLDTNRNIFYLVEPLGLLRYIHMFRTMEDILEFRLKVRSPTDDIIKEMVRQGAALCLGSAQERYSPYFRAGEVSIYHEEPKRLYKYLKTAEAGETVINVYRPEFTLNEKFFIYDNGEERYTTRVQTVIDMFCDDKGAYSKPLLKELWEVEV